MIRSGSSSSLTHVVEAVRVEAGKAEEFARARVVRYQFEGFQLVVGLHAVDVEELERVVDLRELLELENQVQGSQPAEDQDE